MSELEEEQLRMTKTIQALKHSEESLRQESKNLKEALEKSNQSSLQAHVKIQAMTETIRESKANVDIARAEKVKDLQEAASEHACAMQEAASEHESVVTRLQTKLESV